MHDLLGISTDSDTGYARWHCACSRVSRLSWLTAEDARIAHKTHAILSRTRSR